MQQMQGRKSDSNKMNCCSERRDWVSINYETIYQNIWQTGILTPSSTYVQAPIIGDKQCIFQLDGFCLAMHEQRSYPADGIAIAIVCVQKILHAYGLLVF